MRRRLPRSIRNVQKVSNSVVLRNDSLISAYIKVGDGRRALNAYHRMHAVDALQLSAYTYVALLKASTKLKDIEIGCTLHARIAQSGLLESNLFVSTALVVMYAQHGMLIKAQELFDTLLMHDAVSWNALISGYVQYERSDAALICFEKMQLQGIFPNAVTFTCILKACGSIGAIHKGSQVHSQVIHLGVLETNQFVGNALVDMYAKCGLVVMAKETFSMLPAHNTVTWNTLIAGYMQHEHSEEALKSFDQMQLEGISPDGVTFACTLKACGSLRALEKGKDLHTDVEKRRLLETDQVVANALVDMYAKCGMLAKAQEVFDSLQTRDVVSWSTLIAGYVQQECGQEALFCYEQMRLQGVSPNDVTYACILKACGSIGATVKGQEIHADLDKMGLYKANQLVGNALIDMYAKFGFVAKAQEVFDALPVRNIVSWNTLIAGYVQHEHGKEALHCFEQMRLQGLSPSEVTFSCILKACGLTGAIDKGRELHVKVDERRLLSNNIIVGNALVDMYAKCGDLTMAQEVFEKLPLRDIISWNALIAGYVQHECFEEALNCFARMQSCGVSVDAVTLASCLKACGNIGAVERGKELHFKIETEGLFKTNQLVGNTLVSMYVKYGMPAKAQEVFDTLPTRDIVSWTALIAGYAQLGEYADVFRSFDRMRGEGIIPNPVTFLSVLSACSHTGLVDKGQMYFEAMSEFYGITPTLEHHICMVDLFSRAGQLDRAVAYAKKASPHANILMWLTVLGACRKWGNVALGRQAFDQVLLLDERETSAFICMYNIYADAGMYDDAKQVEAIRVEKQTSMSLGAC